MDHGIENDNVKVGTLSADDSDFDFSLTSTFDICPSISVSIMSDEKAKQPRLACQKEREELVACLLRTDW